jgi:hypothetical protein
VGRLKNAIDEEITRGAGEDIYAHARAIRQLRAQTLDDPRGISQLFDTDPNNPINRSTALEKIPEKLTPPPIDQYAHVIETLQGMPEELQPSAQPALGEIRAHLLNKTLQAGAETRSGTGAPVLRARAFPSHSEARNARPSRHGVSVCDLYLAAMECRHPSRGLCGPRSIQRTCAGCGASRRPCWPGRPQTGLVMPSKLKLC